MIVKPYFDVEFLGSGGGNMSFINPGSQQFEIDMSKKKETIYAVVEKIDPKTRKMEFESVRITVDPRGSATVNKNEKIKKIQTLYALSANDAEFNHFMEIDPKDVETFAYYILGLKEINRILNNHIDILQLKTMGEITKCFGQYYRYLIFSPSSDWRYNSIIETDGPARRVKSFNTSREFVCEKFTDKELEKLVALNFKKESGTFISKVAQALKHYTDNKQLFETLKIYNSNVDLLKEYDIVWDKVVLRSKPIDNISDFINKVSHIADYKILNKILSRLNSHQRQEIKSNLTILNSYLSLATRIYRDNFNITQLEPVLSRLNKYRNVDHLLNALNSMLSEFDLYKLRKELRFYFGAHVVYFNDVEQIMVIKIGTYEAMKNYGSKSWCVQQSHSTYTKYTLGGLNNFYIAIDAKAKDNDSMIGFTVSPSGKILEAQNRANHNVSIDSLSYRKCLNGWWGNLFSLNRFRFF